MWAFCARPERHPLAERPTSVALALVWCLLGAGSAAFPQDVETITTNPPATPAPLAEAAGHNDERRVTRRFVANLGRSAAGLFSSDNLKPLLVGSAASGAGAFLDAELVEDYRKDRFKELGRIGEQLGKPYVLAPLAGALYLSGRLSGHERFRAGTYDVAQAFLVNAAYTTVIKYAARRERPDGSNRRSFPSGHTSNAFAWATVAHHHYGAKLGVPGYVLAGLIGASRLEKNVHHLSDVLAGATLGYLVGRTVVREDARPIEAPVQVRLAALPPPSGRGLGLALVLTF